MVKLPVLLTALALSLAHADIDLRGQVLDEATRLPLAGAKVELASAGLSSLSDAKGLFALSQVTSRAENLPKAWPDGMLRLDGTRLSFEVGPGQALPVTLYATGLGGRNILLYAGFAPAGSHSVELPTRLQAAGLYLLHASIGKARGSRLIHVLHDGRITWSETAKAPRGRLAKSAAAWDTLIVGKAGYATARIPVTSSSDSLPAIALKPAPVATEGPIGFAMVAGTTTGGGNATPTRVTTFAQLKAAAADKAPRVIVISGTIKTEGGYTMPIASHKTILGENKSATLHGGISVTGGSNVILRNFNMRGIWPNSGPDDAIAINNSHHIWIDHLNIWDAGDGNLDITNQSSYVTVSWCKFWYTDKSHPHRLNALIGSGGGDHPEDAGKLKVTYHHNWFADLVDQRMPRLMYGQAHVFNNYYTSTGNSYCVGVGSYGAILVENNYFKPVANPHQFMYDVYMEMAARGNVYDNTTGKKDAGRGGSRHSSVGGGSVSPFTAPPYDYKADRAEDVPGLVTRGAGPQ